MNGVGEANNAEMPGWHNRPTQASGLNFKYKPFFDSDSNKESLTNV